jgi:putative transposase
MKKTRFTEAQIVAILKSGDAGLKVKDICREHGISEATYNTGGGPDCLTRLHGLTTLQAV